MKRKFESIDIFLCTYFVKYLQTFANFTFTFASRRLQKIETLDELMNVIFEYILNIFKIIQLIHHQFHFILKKFSIK